MFRQTGSRLAHRPFRFRALGDVGHGFARIATMFPWLSAVQHLARQYRNAQTIAFGMRQLAGQVVAPVELPR